MYGIKCAVIIIIKLPFVLRTLVPSLVCISPQQLGSLTPLFHHLHDVVSVESLAQRPPIQKALSAKIDDFQFNQLFNSSSLADRARLLSISSPHASSWLSVVPSEGLGLHLNPDQFQVAIKWWLGLDTSGGSLCSLCPDTVLDPLGHHASTCKRGGDAVFRHNRLRDVVAESCRLAHLSVKVEAGSNLTPDHSHTRPADVLVQNWSRGRPRLERSGSIQLMMTNVEIWVGFVSPW